MKKGLFVFKVHDLVEIAILCALAVVLDMFVRIPLGASGGSINISMIPIFIISLRHGWFKGFFAGGLVYGLITCLLDNYGIITYPLDYLIGFGSVAIIGFFAKYINNKQGKTFLCYLYTILATFAWGIVRFFASSFSSVLIYQYSFEAAFIYNLSYVFISVIADAIILCFILYPICKLANVFPTTFIKELKKSSIKE